MTTAIIITIIILYAIICVKRYMKNLNKGCCGGGSNVIREIPTIDESQYLIKETYKVEGMHCEKCAVLIERKLNKSSIYQVIVDLKQETLTLYSKENNSYEEVHQILKDLGYSIVK